MHKVWNWFLGKFKDFWGIDVNQAREPKPNQANLHLGPFKMSLQFWQKYNFLTAPIRRLWLWDARQKLEKIAPYLSKNEHILEVGSGLGTVAHTLRQADYQVEPLDIQNHSLFPEIQPTIYDGRHFPYEDNHFDTVLILTVLHHTPHPEQIVAEAQRVGRKIIIIEDIYQNIFQKYLTFAVDSVVNWEFVGHPHSNRTDRAWRATFAKLGLEIKASYAYRFVGFFRQVLYVLERAEQ